MIDAHCHLYELENIETEVQRFKGAGGTAIICNGAGMESSRKAIELVQKYPEVYATVGVHPEERDPSTALGMTWDILREMTREPKVVAIGECGLDTDSDEEVALFKQNIELAKETKLPLVVHCRNQFEKVFEVLDYDRVQMHCFTGTMDEMEECVRRRWYISFGGILTFKKSLDLRSVAKNVPEDRLLIETDSPYLAPEPVRGQKNTPANVKHVAEVLALARGISVDEIDRITTENARRLFGL